MQKLLILGIIVLLCPSKNHAQNLFNKAAPLVATGQATAASKSEWSVYDNPAALQSSENNFITSSIFFPNQFYSIPSIAATYAQKLRNGDYFALKLSNFGDDYYSERQLSPSYIRKWGPHQFSLTLNANQLHIQAINNQLHYSTSLGAFLQLSPSLYLGADIKNIFSITQEQLDQQLLQPTIFSIGLSYQLTNHFVFLGEIEKNLQLPHLFKFGAEYNIIRYITIQAGISTSSWQTSAGLAFNLPKFSFAVAQSFHPYLGHSFSISTMLVNL